MHKFTVFTLLFSTMVVVVMADLVLNNYWGADFVQSAETTEDSPISVTTEISRNTTDVLQDEPSSLPLEERSDDTDETPAFNDAISTPETSNATTTTSEDFSSASVTSELITTLNFSEPSLETAFYDGLIFGFWDTQDPFKEYTVFYHKLFDGPDYVGSIYEIETPTETKTFAAYQTLRDVAQNSTSGTMNETNSYGDASFYFNHATKTNSVFLVLQKNGRVYGLEYTPSYHSAVRGLIEAL